MDLPGLGHTEAVSAYLIHHNRSGSGGVMWSSGIIDLAIGLAFVFGVTAALASMITELVSRFLGLRGAYLLAGLRELLDSGQVETNLTKAKNDYEAWKGIISGPPPRGTRSPRRARCWQPDPAQPGNGRRHLSRNPPAQASKPGRPEVRKRRDKETRVAQRSPEPARLHFGYVVRRCAHRLDGAQACRASHHRRANRRSRANHRPR